MIFEVQSGAQTYEVDAPDQAAAIRAIQGLVSEAKTGKSDHLPMAAGATQHAMPAETIQGGPTPVPMPPPSVGADIGDSAASRLQAGLLDVPGIPGDMTSLAGDLGSAAAQGLLGLFGVSREKRAQAHQAAEAIAPNPLGFLPGSEDVKKEVGFEAYKPQTEAGDIFNRYVGAGIELVPSVMATGGAGTLRKVGGDALKYALAPAAAGEAAGEATKGSALAPWARTGAMIATGGVAGAGRGRVTGASSVDEWRAVGKQAYRDMEAAGVVVKPNIYDAAVNKIDAQMKLSNLDPSLHKDATAVLKRLQAEKGTPKTFEELDRLHQLAMEGTKAVEPRERAMAGILADKIDNFMETLKPGDLQGGNPKAAFNSLIKGRDAWRRMRSGERIGNIIAKATDRAQANYTSAGAQTALRQEFKNFKWKGQKISREYQRMSKEEKAMVDSMIGGATVENVLRNLGKFNLKNPFVYGMLGVLGVTLNPSALALAGLAAVGSGVKGLSARMAARKAMELGELVRGGKRAPRDRRIAPNSILYGLASERAANRPEDGR